MCGEIPGSTAASSAANASSFQSSTGGAGESAAPPPSVEDLPADAPIEQVVLAILQVPAGTAVSGGTTLVSLGMTSMHAIEVAEAIQNRAGVMVPLEQLLMYTMADVRKHKVDLKAAAAMQEEMKRLASVPDLRLEHTEDSAAAAAGGDNGIAVGGPLDRSDSSSTEGEEAQRSGSSSSRTSDSSAEDEAAEADVPPGVGRPMASVLAIGTSSPPTLVPQWQFSREYLKRVNSADPLLQDKLNRICECELRKDLLHN